jgi:hypothetical protein
MNTPARPVIDQPAHTLPSSTIWSTQGHSRTVSTPRRVFWNDPVLALENVARPCDHNALLAIITDTLRNSQRRLERVNTARHLQLPLAVPRRVPAPLCLSWITADQRITIWHVLPAVALSMTPTKLSVALRLEEMSIIIWVPEESLV